MSGVYPERVQATAPGPAAAPAAGQALNRVRDLARAWATLQASPGGDAGEVPARAGRTLLDVIHFNWGSSAEEILRLVTRIAEGWLSPGADLFCPAAGQEVLDVIKGDAASGPHARIAREHLGRVVRQAWVQWASGQPGAKPSWLIPWEELDDAQREADMRIGEAVADAAIAAAGLAKSPEQVGIIAGTMAAYERDSVAPGLADAQAEIRQLREQLCSALAETRQLRELLDEIGVMAANAPEDGDSFGLLEEIAMRIAEPPELRAEAGPYEPGSVDIGEGTVWEDVKAAPELAASMAETRQLRDLAAEILAAFGPSGSGHTARVGQVQIRRWRERAGLEG